MAPVVDENVKSADEALGEREKEYEDDKSFKMSLTCKTVRTSFPSVRQMQTSELQELMSSSHVVLLVRNFTCLIQSVMATVRY